MNRTLARTLRTDAVELREIYKETGSIKQMRQAKARMLAEVYRVLVLNLGEPPTEFPWRYTVKDKANEENEGEDGDDDSDENDEDEDGDDDSDEDDEDEDGDDDPDEDDEDEDEDDDSDEDDEEEDGDDDSDEDDEDDDEDDDSDEDDYDVEQKWSERRVFTPKSFYREFIGLDLSQYVNIADDPIRPKGGHYEIELTRNLYDGQNAHYANVHIETLRAIVVEVLLDNKAVYFAADVSPDQDSSKGIMARNLYDYESVYEIELDLTKTERILFRDSTINHGMAFIGVDLVEGEPAKWLVENSWGSERGRSGLWTMYDDWFEDNVYNVIVHRDYVPAEVREILEQPAKKLPVWDPMW
jgi:aminopeptidase C